MFGISNERLNTILLSVFNMLLLLGVFFLGFNASAWTNGQIQQYCMNYNMLPKPGNCTGSYDYYGNFISNKECTTIPVNFTVNSTSNIDAEWNPINMEIS